jgi:mannose-1-phosphate guanylyltransferase/mannose-6-phosphate isomerase
MNVLIHNTAFAATDIAQNSRAWGECGALFEHDRFKVRHLVIHPGQKLGLQSHLHRSEHWIAVSGTGRVTIGDTSTDLFESQSIDIAIGAVHQIENHGKIDLHLIEVQTGAYLGDDDVIRYGPQLTP